MNIFFMFSTVNVPRVYAGVHFVVIVLGDKAEQRCGNMMPKTQPLKPAPGQNAPAKD